MLDGKMEDDASVKQCQVVVELAHQLAARDPELADGLRVRVSVTMTDFRPRRSVLYMPAANERALEKAKTIPADALIFDLEDAVAPDAKPAARDQACAAAASGAYGRREIAIRCNGLDTAWGSDDLRAAATSGASAVVIPKVGSILDLNAVSAELDTAGAPATMWIWAMIETPTAVLDVRAIAAHHRVGALVMGTNDLAKELRARTGPWSGTARAAPRRGAAGRTRVGQGHPRRRLQRRAGRRGVPARMRAGRRDGLRRQDTHPPRDRSTSPTTSGRPTTDEIAYARRVIEAFEAALADGRGVITVDGRMIENLHVDNARRTIAVADAIADTRVSGRAPGQRLSSTGTQRGPRTCPPTHVVSRVRVDLVVREGRQPFLQRNEELEAGQVRADAAMHPEPERGVTVDLPVDHELAGSIEHRGITVGGREREQHLLTAGEPDTRRPRCRRRPDGPS